MCRLKKMTVTVIVFLSTVLGVDAQSWQWVFPDKLLPLAEQVYEMKNLEGDTVVAAVYDGGYCKLLRSTDRGRTWAMIIKEKGHPDAPVPDPFNPSCAFLLCTDAMYVAFDEVGSIKRYHRDPSRQDTFRLKTNGYIRYMFMRDTLHGVATDKDSIYVTRNGWRTRKAVVMPGGGNVSDVFIFNDLRVGVFYWSRGVNYMAITSMDSITAMDSVKWHTTESAPYLSRVFFLSDSIAWGIGYRPAGIGDLDYHIIYHTTDGGKTWSKQLDTFRMEFGLQDIKFRDERVGIAVGQFNVVYQTTDGGASWIHSKMPAIEDGAPTMTACYTKDAVLVGTFLGNIYRKPYIDSVTTVEDIVYADWSRGTVGLDSGLKLFPQPAANALFVSGEDEAGYDAVKPVEHDFEIMTMESVVISKGRSSGRIDIEAISPGVYVLRYGSRARVFVKQ